MNKCLICDKSDDCKKNKNSNTSNCRLFIPNKEKEIKHLKEVEESNKRLKKLFSPFEQLEALKSYKYY